MNRVIKSALYVSFALCCLSSCTGNSNNKQAKSEVKSLGEARTEFIATLSAADTSAVKSQATRCMELLKADSVDSALDMLYTIDGAKLRKLSDEEKVRMKRRFATFPVLEYEFEYLSFSTQGYNDMKFKTFAKRGQTSGKLSQGFTLMFNPVRIDGQWYLAIKTLGQKSKDILNSPGDNSLAPAEITF